MSKKDFSIDVSDALNIISKHLMLLTADDLKIDEITHLCIKDIIYQALQINNTKLIFNQSQATSVIGRVIKKERERLRYTQDQLAKLLSSSSKDYRWLGEWLYITKRSSHLCIGEFGI